MFLAADFGQYLEKNYCTYEQFIWNIPKLPKFPKSIKKLIDFDFIEQVLELVNSEIEYPKEKLGFLKLYMIKIYLTCAKLFHLSTELILELVGYNGEEKENIINFSKYYGLMRQLVNDNSDFIPSNLFQPSVAKNNIDAFSDLKNNNITLPLQIYLSNSKICLIHDMLQKKSFNLTSKEEEMIFLKMLPYLKKKTIPIGKAVGAKALTFMEHNKEGAFFQHWEDMVAMSEFNKYYHIYFNFLDFGRKVVQKK